MLNLNATSLTSQKNSILKTVEWYDKPKFYDKSYTGYDKPALNAWLLSLSIIKKRGLRVKGIISPG
jgi:hypothetical protein